MNVEKILAIAGKPGLFELKLQTRSGFVAESLLDGKKITVGIRSNVSLLSEISMYTYSEEKPLVEKLDSDYEKNNYNLKLKLVDKLFVLVNGRTSQGVTNILGEEVVPRGTKFTQKLLERIPPRQQ